MKAPLRIGIAGLGTVGAEVVRQLADNRDFFTARAGRALEIAMLCARDAHKDRGFDPAIAPFTADAGDMVGQCDILVELMGGPDGTPLDFAHKTLAAGKPFVTANKAMLAKHWHDIFAYDAPVYFEASVAGGIPVIKVLREGLAGNRISRISGILNGTCNYILSTMEDTGRALDDVLKEAQEKGYAEADPTADVGGHDAAAKLVILAKLAFDPDVTAADMSVEGIQQVSAADVARAADKGQVIRLVGQADAQGRYVVKPEYLDRNHPLAAIKGVTNAVSIEGEPVGISTLIGPGAGAGPTASAVLADLVDAARKTY